MTIQHEQNRLAIIARTPISAWGTDSRKACEPKGGEILKAASISDTQGVLVFETKYGVKHGHRTVVLAAADADDSLTVIADAFAEAPAVGTVSATVSRYREKNVLEAIEAPVWYRVVDSTGKIISDGMSEVWARRMAAGLAEFGVRLVEMHGSKAVITEEVA